MPQRRGRATAPLTNAHASSHPDAASRLTVEQRNAIDLLILGQTDHAVAATVGVARETVSRWRLNPYFVATLNQQRQALWSTAHERLRGLVHRAIDIVEHALSDGDLKAAVELLRIVRLYGEVPAPSGPDDPELVVWQHAQAQTATALRRDVPPVDPVHALLNEQAGQEAALMRERLHALRHEWGMDAEG